MSFFNNYFTSAELVSDLLAEGIYSCGTSRKDRRGYPEGLKTVKLSNRQEKICNNLYSVQVLLGEDKYKVVG